jgi:hypothetical protein
MKTLQEIRSEYETRVQARKTAAELARYQAMVQRREQALVTARMYLEVMFACMTNDEIDRQLNREVEDHSFTEGSARFPLPQEASAAFSQVMRVPPDWSMDDWHKQFDLLCQYAYPEAVDRILDLRSAGFIVVPDYREIAVLLENPD